MRSSLGLEVVLPFALKLDQHERHGLRVCDSKLMPPHESDMLFALSWCVTERIPCKPKPAPSKVSHSIPEASNIHPQLKRPHTRGEAFACCTPHCQAMAGMKPETLATVQIYNELIDFKVPPHGSSGVVEPDVWHPKPLNLGA